LLDWLIVSCLTSTGNISCLICTRKSSIIYKTIQKWGQQAQRSVLPLERYDKLGREDLNQLLYRLQCPATKFANTIFRDDQFYRWKRTRVPEELSLIVCYYIYHVRLHLINSRNQTKCAWHVSGKTFTWYTQNRKVGRPDNLKLFGSH
jgi:hypothetical protein